MKILIAAATAEAALAAPALALDEALVRLGRGGGAGG